MRSRMYAQCTKCMAIGCKNTWHALGLQLASGLSPIRQPQAILYHECRAAAAVRMAAAAVSEDGRKCMSGREAHYPRP
jgi:hypothetical protein